MTKQFYFKIKSGKVNLWKSWGDFLMDPEIKEKVLDTLKQENIKQESSFVFEHETGWYAVGEEEYNGEKLQADENNLFNKMHFAVMKECFEKIDSIPPTPKYQWEMVYDLKV